MSEKLNLCEILKDCPKWTILYSTIYGYVEFVCIKEDFDYPVIVHIPNINRIKTFTSDGRLHRNYGGECTLFPSKEQRDWSKWVRPKMKKLKFDPKTLKPFDKVLAKQEDFTLWSVDLFSFIADKDIKCVGGYFNRCIPYNEETKHLVGTNKEAPEYYRYWEE